MNQSMHANPTPKNKRWNFAIQNTPWKINKYRYVWIYLLRFLGKSNLVDYWDIGFTLELLHKIK